MARTRNDKERKEYRQQGAIFRQERYEKMTYAERLAMLDAGGFGNCAQAEAFRDAIYEGRVQ